MKNKKILVMTLFASLSIYGYAQEANESKTVTIAGIEQDVKESTASISIVSGEDLTKRSAKNVTNSLFGHGLGLTTLQNSGSYSGAYFLYSWFANFIEQYAVDVD